MEKFLALEVTAVGSNPAQTHGKKARFPAWEWQGAPVCPPTAR